MSKLILATTLVLLLALGSLANAALMAIWDFGPNIAGYTLEPQYWYVDDKPTMVAGNAAYDDNGGNGTPFTDAAGNPHIAGQSLHWNDVSGVDSDAYWIMTINTTGWQDTAIRWDYFSDASGGKQGPTSFDFDYKVGGDIIWTEILNNEPVIRDDAWHEFSYDLSSIAAIENQTIVQFRVNDLDRADDNGDYKVDNLELTGVPEPATLVLLGTGLWIFTRKRRSA